MVSPFAATCTWAQARARRDDANTDAAIAARVNVILDADRFDAAALTSFATRDDYPRAARFLTSVAPPTLYNPVTEILKCANVARCAVVFRLVTWDDDPLYGDELRSIARGDDPERAERALCALALTGDCNWSDAPRAARAVFMLRYLVRTFMARPEP